MIMQYASRFMFDCGFFRKAYGYWKHWLRQVCMRSIRYALEIPRAETVIANDFSKKVFHSIQSNVEHNGVGGKVVPSSMLLL